MPATILLRKLLWMRDENLKLGLSNGLLTSGDTTSANQTANVIVHLAGDVAELAISQGECVTTKGIIGTPPAHACPAHTFVEVFDPVEPSTVRGVSNELPAVSKAKTLHVDSEPPKTLAALLRGEEEMRCDNPDGLFYRSPCTGAVFSMVNANEAQNTFNITDVPVSQSPRSVLLAYGLPRQYVYRRYRDEEPEFLAPRRFALRLQRTEQLRSTYFSRNSVNVAKAVISSLTELVHAGLNHDSDATPQLNVEVSALKVQHTAVEMWQALFTEAARKLRAQPQNITAI